MDSQAIFIEPVADRDVTSREPVRLGGLPRLPDGLDWPIDRHGRAAHFLAEINLTAIRQIAERDALPDFPDGTLFVFMFIYDCIPMEFLFYPGITEELPERPVPETVEPLDEEYDWIWDLNTVSACGRVLQPRPATISLERTEYSSRSDCSVQLTGFHFPQFRALYGTIPGTHDWNSKIRSPSIPNFPPYTLPAPDGFPWTWSVVEAVSIELEKVDGAKTWSDRAANATDSPIDANWIGEFHRWMSALTESEEIDRRLLQRVLSRAASDLVDRVWREPFAPAEFSEHDANRLYYGYPKSAPTIQMFGVPEITHSATRDNAENLLLMQFWAGTEKMEGLCQVWIEPDYLREGWFGLAENTVETD